MVTNILLELVLLSVLPAAESASEAKPAPAEEVMEKSIAAHGGPAKIEASRYSVMKAKGILFGPTGEAEFQEVVYCKGEKIRVDQKLAGTDTTVIFDGKDLRVRIAGEEQDIPQTMRDFMVADLTRAATLSDYTKKKYPVERLGTEKLDGREVIRIRATHGKKSEYKTMMFIDAKDFLLRGWSYVGPRIFGGGDATYRYVILDYKPIEGIPTPVKMDAYVDGKRLQHLTLTEMKYEKVSDAIFGAASPAE